MKIRRYRISRLTDLEQRAWRLYKRALEAGNIPAGLHFGRRIEAFDRLASATSIATLERYRD
ncbi:MULTISPECIES: hypothetical protein [unclassified Sphingomonas]|uniref:hypothetical protein n=1 Tax=Novosphingobium rhizosphaerae TaxID=1551649 RepID=UPI0015C813F8